MVDRREFIRCSASLACGMLGAPALFSRAGAERVLRIGTVIDARDADLDAGLTFGADEAHRSASLFGWSVRRVPLAAAALTHTRDLGAVIIGTRMDVPLDVPVIAVRCETTPGAFVVASCDHAPPASGQERVELWHASLERYGAEQLNDRFQAACHRPMTSDAWLGWFAMKVLAEAALRGHSVDAHALERFLQSPTSAFDGHKGMPLRFDARRRLRQPMYVLARSGPTAGWAVAREIDPASER